MCTVDDTAYKLPTLPSMTPRSGGAWHAASRLDCVCFACVAAQRSDATQQTSASRAGPLSAGSGDASSRRLQEDWVGAKTRAWCG